MHRPAPSSCSPTPLYSLDHRLADGRSLTGGGFDIVPCHEDTTHLRRRAAPTARAVRAGSSRSRRTRRYGSGARSPAGAGPSAARSQTATGTGYHPTTRGDMNVRRSREKPTQERLRRHPMSRGNIVTRSAKPPSWVRFPPWPPRSNLRPLDQCQIFLEIAGRVDY